MLMMTIRRTTVAWSCALLLGCASKGGDSTPPAESAPAEPTPSEAPEASEPAETPEAEAAEEPASEPAPALQNLAETLRKQGNATKFLEAAEAAGVMEYLTGNESEVTLIVPTDEAFASAPKAVTSKLARKEEATKLMKYHILPEKMDLTRVMQHRTLPTLAGPEIPVQVIEGTKLYFDKANLVTGNIEATNGQIHFIDQVLLPKK